MRFKIDFVYLKHLLFIWKVFIKDIILSFLLPPPSDYGVSPILRHFNYEHSDHQHDTS